MDEASRNNQDKPPLDYVLTFPDALRAFALVCKHGEKAYAKYNYLKSNKPLSEYTGCLLRHLLAWSEGKDLDDSSGQNHLGHVVWNALALCQFALDKTGIDDRPKRSLAQTWQATSTAVILNDKFSVLVEPSVTDQILDNLANGKEDIQQTVEKLLPRWPDRIDTYSVRSVEDDDKKLVVQFYDLGSYEMLKVDFDSRESGKIWQDKARAAIAIEYMVKSGWARRLD